MAQPLQFGERSEEKQRRATFELDVGEGWRPGNPGGAPGVAIAREGEGWCRRFEMCLGKRYNCAIEI